MDNTPITGTYILVLALSHPHILTIGRSGTFDFDAGWYTYVGSAFGSGGLRGRLKHHLSPVARPHWHIDYLHQVATVEQVWVRHSADSREHAWAHALAQMPGASVPVARFGASDCRCSTHLWYFASYPTLQAFPDDLELWPDKHVRNR